MPFATSAPSKICKAALRGGRGGGVSNIEKESSCLTDRRRFLMRSVEFKCRHAYHRAVRRTFRFLTCLALSASIAFAALPRQPLVPEIEKTDCCAKMKAESASHDCDRHAPKPDPDKQCCAACAFGLAGVVAAATPFVYPPVGDQNFATYLLSEHTRSQRPPVPPPRA